MYLVKLNRCFSLKYRVYILLLVKELDTSLSYTSTPCPALCDARVTIELIGEVKQIQMPCWVGGATFYRSL